MKTEETTSYAYELTTRILSLHKTMNETFGTEFSDEHLKVCISAGVCQAYSDGLNTWKKEEREILNNLILKK